MKEIYTDLSEKPVLTVSPKRFAWFLVFISCLIFWVLVAMWAH